MDTVLLVYDIPERSTATNPSGRLRRLGIRVNLSCWVLPADSVPYHLLDQLAASGAAWHIVRFASDEGERLIQLAESTLQKEVERLAASLEQSVQRAAELLEAGEEGVARAAALERYQRRTRQALTRAQRLYHDARLAAERFQLDPSTIGSIADRVEAIRSAAHARALLFVEASRRIEDEAMRTLASADELPAYVVADLLEEQGEDTRELREALETP